VLAVPDLKAALERNGLLLKQGRELPSVAALVAGGEVRGSWWSHPRSHAIFAALEELAGWRDALSVKLVLGKDTLVHRRLWPALLAVGRSGEDWQRRALGAGPARLLARLEREGELRGAGETGKELARRLLCVSRQEHTTAGRHETVLEDWKRWARREGLATSGPSAARGRAALEDAVAKLGAPVSVLPWRVE
jgi:hypothetical protein